jgi:hypothetical protein
VRRNRPPISLFVSPLAGALWKSPGAWRSQSRSPLGAAWRGLKWGWGSPFAGRLDGEIDKPGKIKITSRTKR